MIYDYVPIFVVPCSSQLLILNDLTGFKWSVLLSLTGNLVYYENITEEDGENPVLIRLREIIVMEFSSKPDSRALLFTPTVQSTKALKDWIEETREFDDFDLNPSRVTGATELSKY